MIIMAVMVLALCLAAISIASGFEALGYCLGNENIFVLSYSESSIRPSLERNMLLSIILIRKSSKILSRDIAKGLVKSIWNYTPSDVQLLTTMSYYKSLVGSSLYTSNSKFTMSLAKLISLSS
jgi:hypothetical protein